MFLAGYYLWVAPHLLLAGYLVWLLRRRLQSQLPIFFVYVVFELVQFLALFTVFLHSPFPVAVYQWVLVFGNGIDAMLKLAVVYELADELLLSRSSLAFVLRPILRGALAVLLLAAAVGSGTFWGISVQGVTNIFEVLDFSSSLILAGMLLALFILARALRISWRSWVAGVALGFGVYACIDLGSAALRAGFGTRTFMAVDITDMAAFHVCVVIWLITLFLSNRKPAFVDATLNLSDLEPWDREMQKMVQQR
jgi:hypothetical protein